MLFKLGSISVVAPGQHNEFNEVIPPEHNAIYSINKMTAALELLTLSSYLHAALSCSQFIATYMLSLSYSHYKATYMLLLVAHSL